LTFIGIKSSVVENFEKTATALFFTVKFVSEIISVKRDKDNNVIEGDPDKIKTVIDKWKFTRPTSSMTPNWYLAEIKNS
jgi:predicted lipid-binding transport protein (Tim44 family)